MKYYIDIKLMGDTEITLGFIWQKLYAQMHLALVDIKDENNRVDIGFSFPFYQNHSFPMGDVLRVCADSKNRLEILDISKWLKGLEDYIHMGQIKEVPSDIKMYASFTRKQFKSNAEIRRLAKRYAKRNNVSEEEALKNFKHTEEKYTKLKEKNKLPFLNIKSLSNGNNVKIFIIKKEVEKKEVGRFDTFGLCKTANVPLF